MVRFAWRVPILAVTAAVPLLMTLGGEASASQFCLPGSSADECLIQLDIGGHSIANPLGNNYPLPNNAPYISGFYADAGYNGNQYNLAPNEVYLSLSANQYDLNGQIVQFNFSKIGLNLADPNITIDPALVSWTGPDAFVYCNTQNCTPFVHIISNQSMDGFGPFNAILRTQSSDDGLPGDSSLSLVLAFTDLNSVIGKMKSTEILDCNHDTAHNPNGGCGASAAALVIVDNLTNPDATAVGGFAAWPDAVDDPPRTIPEPASIGLFGVGLVSLIRMRRRARKI